MQDRASGVGGEFVIVERRSDRQRRRSSTGGASGVSGASAAEEGGGPSRRGSVEAGPSSPTRRASGRRERVNSDAMFSEEERKWYSLTDFRGDLAAVFPGAETLSAADAALFMRRMG